MGTIVEDLLTSQTDWRKTVCFAGGQWEYEGVIPPGRVPNVFRPIGLALTCVLVEFKVASSSLLTCATFCR